MNRAVSVLIWNIQGGHNNEFRHNLRDLINIHHQCMVALEETRMANHISLGNEFCFPIMLEVPAQGQSRGIALLLLDNHVD